MTTSIEAAEWTATALRPTARWVAVSAQGRTQMQMVWSVPTVEVAQVASAA